LRELPGNVQCNRMVVDGVCKMFLFQIWQVCLLFVFASL
jgi:hypothetical protein